MSRTFIDQLGELKDKLARMSAMVQQLVEKAVESVYTADGQLARATIQSDVRINDMERIADCAVNVAQRVIMLEHIGDYQVPADLKLMGNTVITMLRDTMKAFNLIDETIARHVLRSDDVVDALYHQIVQDMLVLMESEREHAQTNLANIMIGKNLERIADHCTNIAEDVIYIYTGRIIRHLHAV
jgi:phosphate transport system protein